MTREAKYGPNFEHCEECGGDNGDGYSDVVHHAGCSKAPTASNTTEQRISYSEGLQRLARLANSMAKEHRKTGHDISADVLDGDAALARELARLCEEAERQKQKIEQGLEPGTNFAGVIAALAAGYPTTTLTPEAPDPNTKEQNT